MSEYGIRVLGIKFASNPHGTRGRFFYGAHGEPLADVVDLDYFVWVVQSDARTLVIDTGFTPEVGRARGRRYLRTPAEALQEVGIDPVSVDIVALSHLHFDHAGGLAYFPNAQFVLQRAEYDFWQGPMGARGELAHSVEARDLELLQALRVAGRLVLLEGDEEIIPGVTAHLVGGHTVGSQVFRMQCGGSAVLACDASHFYRNVYEDIPFAVLHDLPGVYRAFDRVKELAGLGQIIPGHDPALFDSFDPVPGLEGVAFQLRLDNC